MGLLYPEGHRPYGRQREQVNGDHQPPLIKPLLCQKHLGIGLFIDDGGSGKNWFHQKHTFLKAARRLRLRRGNPAKQASLRTP